MTRDYFEFRGISRYLLSFPAKGKFQGLRGFFDSSKRPNIAPEPIFRNISMSWHPNSTF